MIKLAVCIFSLLIISHSAYAADGARTMQDLSVKQICKKHKKLYINSNLGEVTCAGLGAFSFAFETSKDSETLINKCEKTASKCYNKIKNFFADDNCANKITMKLKKAKPSSENSCKVDVKIIDQCTNDIGALLKGHTRSEMCTSAAAQHLSGAEYSSEQPDKFISEACEIVKAECPGFLNN